MFSAGIGSGILEKIKAVKDAASEIAYSALESAKDAAIESKFTDVLGLGRAMLGALSVDRKSNAYTAANGAENINKITELEKANAKNQAANNSEDAATVAGVLANALSQARVYMEGREVGRLVAPTVNEIIGRQARAR